MRKGMKVSYGSCKLSSGRPSRCSFNPTMDADTYKLAQNKFYSGLVSMIRERLCWTGMDWYQSGVMGGSRSV